MAQDLTVTVSTPYLRSDAESPFWLALDWVSAADGSVALNILEKARISNSALPSKINGKLKKIETVPGLLGDKATDCPTTLYDITLTDSYGLDVATGSLADRSAAVAEAIYPAADVIINDDLKLNISNAGDSRKGRIILTFE